MFHISTFYDCCERDYSFLKQSLSKKADELSIVGTIILTPEGINSTIACANLENLYSFETYISKYFPSCLLYTSPSPRDRTRSRMPSSA